MKKTIATIGFMVFLIGVLSLPSSAASRVVCEVTYTSDHSATIQLKWSDPAVKTPLMISGWTFQDAKTLTVYYKSGKEVVSGWDQRTITHDTYTFPMKINVAADQQEVIALKDVPTTYKNYGSIMNLYHRGIISGYPDGTFKASATVTRAEFAKMLLLSAKYTQITTLKSTFSDLKESYWAKTYIMTLASKDILKGKGNLKFDPQGTITIGEVITVLSRTFDTFQELSPYGSTLTAHWSNDYFLDAVQQGMVLKTDSFYKPYTPNQKATRETIAVLLSRMLEQLHEVAK
jgi:hypothetical protein